MKTTHNDSVVPKNQKQVELSDIFRLYADGFRQSHALSYEQLKSHAPYPNMPNRGAWRSS